MATSDHLTQEANNSRDFEITLQQPKQSDDEEPSDDSKLDAILDLLSDEETTGPPPQPPVLRNEEGKIDVSKVIQYFEKRAVSPLDTLVSFEQG